MSTRFLSALVISVLVLVVWQFLLPGQPRNLCAVDLTRPIEQMLAARWQGESSVPKGFVVEQGAIEWQLRSGGHQFALPSRTAKVESIGSGFRGTAICKVKDPNGNWWLVTGRDRSGFLSYVPEEDTTVIAKP